MTTSLATDALQEQGELSMAHRSSVAHLELVGVGRKFGDVTAVNSVSFTLQKGEFVTLLGSSGSGKTTTLNMVAGQLLPSSGKILLDGRDITRLPAQARDMGMVFQSYALFPHMTVEQNVAFPLKMRRIKKAESRQRVGEVLALVGLNSLAKRYPRQLSGGQQQRVALARALVFDPSVLLMDEPLGALDRKLRKSLQEEIVRTCREAGATVLYVTHDQEEALSMSDRIALYEAGSIQQYGSPKELYEFPETRFVAEFVGDINVIALERIEVNGDRVDVTMATGTRTEIPKSHCAALEGPICAVVRPEAMSIVPAIGARDDNRGIRGTLRGRIYSGSSATFLVEVPGLEKPIRVDHRPHGSLPNLTEGEDVIVSWLPGAVRLVPDTKGAMTTTVQEANG